MEHELTMNFTEEQYNFLAEEAEKTGFTIEEVFMYIIRKWIANPHQLPTLPSEAQKSSE